MKKALIIGIDGQVGHYLSAFLKDLGYIVRGTFKHPGDTIKDGSGNFSGNEWADPADGLYALNLDELQFLEQIFREFRPDEIYCLDPVIRCDHQGDDKEIFVANYEQFLEKLLNLIVCSPENRPSFFQAVPDGIYGHTDVFPQSELTPFLADNMYFNVLKKAFQKVSFGRDEYGLHVSNGILFSPVSPFQSASAFPKYITQTLCKIILGKEEQLLVGDLTPRRDRGHAKDYARAMHLAVQQEHGDDYVFATGVSVNGENLIYHAARQVGMTIRFTGEENCRAGYLTQLDVPLFVEKAGPEFLEHIKDKLVGPDLSLLPEADQRKAMVISEPQKEKNKEPFFLLGDYTKAKTILGWEPEYHYLDVLKEMMDADLSSVAGFLHIRLNAKT